MKTNLGIYLECTPKASTSPACFSLYSSVFSPILIVSTFIFLIHSFIYCSLRLASTIVLSWYLKGFYLFSAFNCVDHTLLSRILPLPAALSKHKVRFCSWRNIYLKVSVQTGSVEMTFTWCGGLGRNWCRDLIVCFQCHCLELRGHSEMNLVDVAWCSNKVVLKKIIKKDFFFLSFFFKPVVKFNNCQDSRGFVAVAKWAFFIPLHIFVLMCLVIEV